VGFPSFYLFLFLSLLLLFLRSCHAFNFIPHSIKFRVIFYLITCIYNGKLQSAAILTKLFSFRTPSPANIQHLLTSYPVTHTHPFNDPLSGTYPGEPVPER